MGAYAQFAERLIERGYAAIPIMPGTKRPGFFCAGMWMGLTNWQMKFVGQAPSLFERQLWSKGDTGIGVVAGPASGGMIGADIDTDDSAIKAALSAVLPQTPAKKRGAKGETLFFYGPEIKESKSWNINGKRVIDLIGPGRQTVLPPSLHPDTGSPYVWSGAETLEDLEPHELPEVHADLIEKISATLAPFGYVEDKLSSASKVADGDEKSPHRQLNEAALAKLASWVPALGLYRCRRTRHGFEAVPIWRPSTTGRPAEKRKLNLKIVPEGIRDFGADRGYTALDLVIAACGCDLDTAWKFLSEQLGWSDGPVIELPAAKPELKEVKPEPKQTAPAADALEQYTHNVPGIVGDTIEWIVGTARRPNRVLALGAAITIVGTLIGRRVAGPTRSATHLYVVSVGPTGSGKQHLFDSTTQLMKSAGAESHIGPSEFISMPAVINFLLRKPLALCLQDEYGAFLKRITSRKASGFESSISKILRTLWSTSFAAMTTAEWANREMKVIQSPAISIYGLSTPEEFHAALQGESVGNGFLNRYLVLGTETRASDSEPRLISIRPPANLADELRKLYLWTGANSILQIDDPTIAFVPDVLPWASEQAAATYHDFERMRDQSMDDEPQLKPYIARVGEMAVRLATIRAAGRCGPGAAIDQADMEWGAGIAWTAGQALATAAMEYLPENERGTYVDKIAGLIERRRSVMKVRDIQQYVRGRLRSGEIKDILAQLVEAGVIERAEDGYRSSRR